MQHVNKNLLYYILSCFFCTPVFSAATADSILERLSSNYESINHEVFFGKIRNEVRRGLKIKPADFYEIETRTKDFYEFGLNSISDYIRPVLPFKWLDGRPEWNAICCLHGIIASKADNPECFTADALVSELSQSSTELGESIKRLLQNCQGFLNNEREHILEYDLYDEYDFSRMRNALKSPRVVFCRKIIDEFFPSLQQDNGLLMVWYDAMLIFWVDVCFMAHQEYNQALVRRISTTPILDWRAISFAPAVDYVTPVDYLRCKVQSVSDDSPEKLGCIDADGESSNTGSVQTPFQGLSAEDGITDKSVEMAEVAGDPGNEVLSKPKKSGSAKVKKPKNRVQGGAGYDRSKKDKPIITSEGDAELQAAVTVSLSLVTTEVKKLLDECLSQSKKEFSDQLADIRARVDSLRNALLLQRSSQVLHVPLLPGAKLMGPEGSPQYICVGGTLTPVEVLYKQLLAETGFGRVCIVNASQEALQGIRVIPQSPVDLTGIQQKVAGNGPLAGFSQFSARSGEPSSSTARVGSSSGSAGNVVPVSLVPVPVQVIRNPFSSDVVSGGKR